MKVRTNYARCDLVLKRSKQAEEHFSNEVLSALKITSYNALPYPISPDCSGKPPSLLIHQYSKSAVAILLNRLLISFSEGACSGKREDK